MMRKIIFIIQVSFFFSSQNEINVIGKNNKVIFKKKSKETKDLNKENQLKNKNEYKIAVIIVIIIILLFILYLYRNNQKTLTDFEFLKSLEEKDVGNNMEKLERLFKKYQTEKLRVFFKKGESKIFGKIFISEGMKYSFFKIEKIQSDINNYIGEPNFSLIVQISNFEKFYEEYENKIVTEEMIKDYVKKQNNE